MARRRNGEMAMLEPLVEHQPPCRHYWIIDTPQGPTSRGVCQLCGQAREFKNFLDEEFWRERREALSSQQAEDPLDWVTAPQGRWS